MSEAADQPFTEKGLYKLLVRSFPECRTRQHIFDVRKFSDLLTMSPEGVYKWLRADKLSADGASKVLNLVPEGKHRATLRGELVQYVLR